MKMVHYAHAGIIIEMSLYFVRLLRIYDDNPFRAREPDFGLRMNCWALLLAFSAKASLEWLSLHKRRMFLRSSSIYGSF